MQDKEKLLLLNKITKLKNRLLKTHTKNAVTFILNRQIKMGLLPSVSSELLKIKGVEKARKRFSNNYKLKRSIFLRDENKCSICETSENLEIDHIKPIALYPNLCCNPKNLRLLCTKCNRSKLSTCLR